MTTNAYIISWCEEGLEGVVPITEYEQWDAENTFRILNNEEPVRNPLNGIIQNMILRAQVNAQRHYEIYAIDCSEDITQETIQEWFDVNPQAAADLLRERGHRMYSNRASANRIRIV